MDLAALLSTFDTNITASISNKGIAAEKLGFEKLKIDYSIEHYLNLLKYLVSNPEVKYGYDKGYEEFQFFNLFSSDFYETLEADLEMPKLTCSVERFQELFMAYFISRQLQDALKVNTEYDKLTSSSGVDNLTHNKIYINLTNIMRAYLTLALDDSCPSELVELFENSIDYDDLVNGSLSLRQMCEWDRGKKWEKAISKKYVYWEFEQETKDFRIKIIKNENLSHLWGLEASKKIGTSNKTIGGHCGAATFEELKDALKEVLDRLISSAEALNNEISVIFTKYNYIQDIMDKAYNIWHLPENQDIPQEDFMELLPKNIRKVVAYGNLNYQVCNGGFSQYFYNDYYSYLPTVMNFLRQLNTKTSEKVLGILSKVRSVYSQILIQREKEKRISHAGLENWERREIEVLFEDSTEEEEEEFDVPDLDIEAMLFESLDKFDDQFYELNERLLKEAQKYVMTHKKDFSF